MRLAASCSTPKPWWAERGMQDRHRTPATIGGHRRSPARGRRKRVGAEVDAGLGVSGLQFDGAAEGFKDVLGIAGGEQSAAERVVPLGVFRRQRDGAPPGGETVFQRPPSRRAAPRLAWAMAKSGAEATASR